MFYNTDRINIPVGSTRDLEKVERQLNDDTGYMPDNCDGMDCEYFHQCKSDPNDYDLCPLMDWGNI